MLKPVVLNVNFPQIERDRLKKWYAEGIVQKYLHRNDDSKKRFSFLDGPITANNPMGVHHAWGRTYKDLWQRFWNMRGYKERFQNGFDCQGLWVEVEVEKELGIHNKKDIENLVPGDKKASIAKFVQLCKDRVIKFSTIQTEQTKRLGNFMDWENSYFTMSDENNYMIWHFLKTCHEKGWIYKGKDSVPWCPRCETAISQHEMLTEDYKELTHETVFVKFKIQNSQLKFKTKDAYLLVWTTTPWSVPADVAVGVNITFTYGIWRNKQTDEVIIFIDKDENDIVPTRMLKKKELPIAEYIFAHVDAQFEKVGEISGKELLGMQYVAPFDTLPLVQKAEAEYPKTFHTVIDASDVVVSTEGTGLLHVAPGCGKEDFDLGKKYQLSTISSIDDTATYVDGLGEFSGKNAKKHPELIIDYLKSIDDGKYLLKTLHYTHRYPACWRCKSELVWKVADEWYIAMDTKEKGGEKTLREQMVATAKMIEWHPSFGLERELDWLKNMHDWMISKKNRYWGLALPIYSCQHCGQFTVIGSKEELERQAVEGWGAFSGHSPHKPFIDEVKIQCNNCKETISRIDDVGNVWLDAGIVPFSTLIDPETKKLSYTTDKKYWEQWFPADFITESFPGQFKNWFYSLIAMSTVLEKRNSFKRILGYASMLAEDGRPMHKSWGNSIEFNEGADKIGVDVMRWMFATTDPEQNLLFGYKKADETRRRFHLMLWNIYNFFVTYATIDGWKPPSSRHSGEERSSDSRIDSGHLSANALPSRSDAASSGEHRQVQAGARMINSNVLDSWILSRLHETITICTESLEKYNIQKAALEIEGFVHDLSLWYVRRSRERIGPSADDGEDKNACYQTLYLVLIKLSALLAPFIPFISDEIYTNLTGEESVHLAEWPRKGERKKGKGESLIEEMKVVRKIVEVALSQRKAAQKKVRQPLSLLTITEKTELSESLLQLIKDEVNVKEIKQKKGTFAVNLDTETMTPELQAEGEARDIVRRIQDERKKLGTKLDDKVDVTLETWPEKFEEYIKKNALVRNLQKGTFQITKIHE